MEELTQAPPFLKRALAETIRRGRCRAEIGFP
jgi:hypothetical protein